jgi:hypothetical protein
MPQLITYDGRPVKRRRRIAGGTLLIFYAACPSDSGPQLVVSDEQWNSLGRVRYFTASQLPDVRALAAASSNPFFHSENRHDDL